MSDIKQQIAQLKSQRDWFKGESYALRSVEVLTNKIKDLEAQLASGKKIIKVLDNPD